jgi:hypothetical protein
MNDGPITFGPGLRGYLEGRAKAMRFFHEQEPGFNGYDRHSEFLLAHGRSFQPDAKTFAGRQMTMKMCYMNCAKRALRDPSLTYVEGYVQALIPVEHAWLLKDGRIIDPTLRPTAIREIGEYFGVPFSTPFLRANIAAGGGWSVFDWQNGQRLADLYAGKLDWRPS